MGSQPEHSTYGEPPNDHSRVNLAELFRLHTPEVRQHIVHKIAAEWQRQLTPDDVLQTTYIDALRDFGQFAPRGNGSFAQWLKRIADRNIVDAIRGLQAEARRVPKARLVRFGHQLDASVSFLQTLAADGPSSPSRSITKSDAVRLLSAAFDQLPPEHRIVVERYDLQGCSIAAIAEEIGRTEGATYMIRTRAHQRLRELLAKKATGIFTNP